MNDVQINWGGRASGKTAFMLLQAAEQVRRGERVLVLSRDRRALRKFRDQRGERGCYLARDILDESGGTATFRDVAAPVPEVNP